MRSAHAPQVVRMPSKTQLVSRPVRVQRETLHFLLGTTPMHCPVLGGPNDVITQSRFPGHGFPSPQLWA